MSKRTMYIDVTQLVHWDGHLTGIPRVMYELAVRFHEDGARFVSWVRQRKCYCEIDFGAYLNGRGLVYLRDNTEPDTPNTHKTTGDQKEIGIEGRVDNLKIFSKKVANKVINGTRLVHSGAPEKIRDTIAARAARNYKKVELAKGDSVFIGWGEWWDENFLTMLEQSHRRGAKISTIIHDIGPMVAPHLAGNSASLAEYCARVVPLCAEVFVNSKFTKKTLVDWLKQHNFTVPPITTFTLGDNFHHTYPKKPTSSEFLQSGLKGGDFIITVGTIEIKKNHLFYYYVYRLALERGINLPKLVIVGRRGYGTEMAIQMMQQDPQLKDKFVFLFNTSDEELAWLYENTQFALFASLYEGWGMPLAESLFHGVPAISARSTSLVEIGDGIVERFTQGSTDECLAAMCEMLKPQTLAKKRRQARTYKPMLWNDSYNQITKRLIKKEIM